MSDQFTNRLSDYLDDELPPHEREALEGHLVTCQECTETLTELRRVIGRARALDDRPTSGDLWPAIARRIAREAAESEVVDLGTRRSRHGLVLSLPKLAAAAVALMAVSGGSVWLAMRDPAVVTLPVAEGPGDPGTVVRPASRFPSERYDLAVADLERALEEGRGRLDSSTVRVIEQNLALVDRAIQQARAALTADPSSVYLNGHLADAMQRKLQLLRRAASLAGSTS